MTCAGDIRSAEAAAHRPCHRAAAGDEALFGLGFHPDLHIDPVPCRDDINAIDLVRRGDAFGQGEAIGEIGQIGRGGHHHCLRRAVEGQRDRHLFGQGAGPLLDARGAEAQPGKAARGLHHSAARMRREWAACASYFSCHSVGPLEGLTCTAVTLYSGQLVAQSEKSVVMTLACVVGWWKVV